MEVRKRIFLIRMIEKMENNDKYSKKLGMKNQSGFKHKKRSGIKEI